jgi:hypothetical protein
MASADKVGRLSSSDRGIDRLFPSNISVHFKVFDFEFPCFDRPIVSTDCIGQFGAECIAIYIRRSRQITFILKALISPIDIKKVKIPGDI